MWKLFCLRLCELLTTPTKHYRSTEKYLRALEKTINIVTTVTENGERLTGRFMKKCKIDRVTIDWRYASRNGIFRHG